MKQSSTEIAAGKIFLCYRREDSGGYTGRVYDRLNQRFPGRVFMDVAGVGIGTRWAEVIEKTLASCDVFVILIGRRWLERDPGGTRRIDNPEDSLYTEISTALRLKLKIIPLLVAGAAVPQPGELPPALAPITDWQALRLDDDEFDHDSSRLIEALERQLQEPADPFRFVQQQTARAYAPESPPPSSEGRTGRGMVFGVKGLVGGLGAAIAAAILIVLMVSASKEPANVLPDTGGPPPAGPQISGEYELVSYALQGVAIPLSGSMRLVPVSDGHFRFEMSVTHASLGVFRYSGRFEGQGANWTMTTVETNDPTAVKAPIPTQVRFDGSTLGIQSLYASAVWRKHPDQPR
jgi:hypothetical protein